MAVWGAEVSREDDPERAVRAALSLQQALGTTGAAADRRLTMRVGVSTGLALLGAVGRSSEFTAIGDTVNVASRPEHAAPAGGVLISHDTYRHIRGVFDVSPLPPLAVKGKSDLLSVYVVHGAKPHAFRTGTRGVEGVETRMVGRALSCGPSGTRPSGRGRRASSCSVNRAAAWEESRGRAESIWQAVSDLQAGGLGRVDQG